MAGSHTICKIRLEQMPQLTEARDIKDDWTGITDPQLRRKIQNRLKVRAYRRRKAGNSQLPSAPSSAPNIHATSPKTESQLACWNEDQQIVSIVPEQLAKSVARPRGPLLPHTFGDIPLNETIVFPLTSDHLITLVQFNVLRAAMTNLRLLSALHTVPPECSNALRIAPVPTFLSPTSEQPIPPSLFPTPLQRAVPHDKWINILPHPAWRDNLIKGAGTFDTLSMRHDLLGGLWEGFSDSECERRGLIAWSTPWEISGWEVSEGFLKKWGWSLRGCEGVLEATNRWRALRGEEPLAVKI